ncbi:MAG TPA: MraY family glycosyltransferase [Acidimicrobiia bacterium]|nr:MraY family glycosyltransferase [Acidimicrobiia bacterium]
MRIPYSVFLVGSAFVLALALTPIVMAAARRIGAVDQPGPRRIHKVPIPTSGGFAMFVVVLGVVWGARLFSGAARALDTRPLTGITIASAIVVALGLVDDLRPLKRSVKLAAEAVAAWVLYMFGLGIPLVTNPFGEPLETGFLNLPLTIIWVLVVVNAINNIDGVDGLAAGAVLIASVTLWYVGRTNGDFYVMFIASAVIGSTAGFLRYNYPPAKVFMGDTGSQFLGLLLAAVALLENRKGATAITLLFPLMAMTVPIADGAITFFHRALGGMPVLGPDNEHVHHRLRRIGLSDRHVVMVLWFLCAYCGMLAVVVATLPLGYSALLAAFLVGAIFLGFRGLAFIERIVVGNPAATPERR